jgi:hypothetical protein
VPLLSSFFFELEREMCFRTVFFDVYHSSMCRSVLMIAFTLIWQAEG